MLTSCEMQMLLPSNLFKRKQKECLCFKEKNQWTYMKQLDKCWHRANTAAIGAVISAHPIPSATLLLCKAAGASTLTRAVCSWVPPHSSSSHTWCHTCCVESMYVQSKGHHVMQASPLCLKLYVYRLLSTVLILTGSIRHVTKQD